MKAKYNVRGGIYFLVILFLTLAMYSCGLREETDSAPGSGGNEPVPVAQFHDLRVPTTLEHFRAYTFNENWLYLVKSRVCNPGQVGLCWDIYKNDVFGEFDPQVYVSGVEGSPITLLADRENNCVLLCQEENGKLSLEKYDEDGTSQWHVEYFASELQGKGGSLTDGVIAGDGRVTLYLNEL